MSKGRSRSLPLVSSERRTDQPGCAWQSNDARRERAGAEAWSRGPGGAEECARRGSVAYLQEGGNAANSARRSEAKRSEADPRRPRSASLRFAAAAAFTRSHLSRCEGYAQLPRPLRRLRAATATFTRLHRPVTNHVRPLSASRLGSESVQPCKHSAPAASLQRTWLRDTAPPAQVRLRSAQLAFSFPASRPLVALQPAWI